MPRRVHGILAACVAVAAGCAGEQGSPQPAADAAVLAPDLSGYEAVAATTPTHERRVLERAASWEAGGLRTVTVVDATRLYRNRAGWAVALRSTPAVPAVDRSSLPSAQGARLVTAAAAPFGERLPDLRPAARVGTWTTHMLGQPSKVAVFIPKAGDDWRVHVTKARSRGDVVVAVFLVPTTAPRSAIDAVLASVERRPPDRTARMGAPDAAAWTATRSADPCPPPSNAAQREAGCAARTPSPS